MNIWILLLATFFVTSVQAQTIEGNYRVIKANGQEYRFPIKEQQKKYPYNIDLVTAAGDTINSAEVLATNGKPTVLLFWVTTCVPCRYELKAIQEKYLQWQQELDFNLYAISIDLPKYGQDFYGRVAKEQWHFPAYYDFERNFTSVMPGNLNGVPQTFLLDKNGNIVYHKRKYAMGDEDKLFEEIGVLLSAKE